MQALQLESSDKDEEITFKLHRETESASKDIYAELIEEKVQEAG